ALQLARLAEESARLARHLNAQVALRAGHAIRPVVDVAPAAAPAPTPSWSNTPYSAGEQHAAVFVHAEERWRQLASRRRRRRSSHGPSPVLRSSLSLEGDSPLLRVETPQSLPGDRNHRPRRPRRNWGGLLLSSLLHVGLLVALGALTLAARQEPQIDTILASFVEDPPPPAEEIRLPEPAEEQGEQLD